jgi:hypothetical protein
MQVRRHRPMWVISTVAACNHSGMQSGTCGQGVTHDADEGCCYRYTGKGVLQPMPLMCSRSGCGCSRSGCGCSRSGCGCSRSGCGCHCSRLLGEHAGKEHRVPASVQNVTAAPGDNDLTGDQVLGLAQFICCLPAMQGYVNHTTGEAHFDGVDVDRLDRVGGWGS